MIGNGIRYAKVSLVSLVVLALLSVSISPAAAQTSAYPSQPCWNSRHAGNMVIGPEGLIWICTHIGGGNYKWRVATHMPKSDSSKTGIFDGGGHRMGGYATVAHHSPNYYSIADVESAWALSHAPRSLSSGNLRVRTRAQVYRGGTWTTCMDSGTRYSTVSAAYMRVYYRSSVAWCGTGYSYRTIATVGSRPSGTWYGLQTTTAGVRFN